MSINEFSSTEFEVLPQMTGVLPFKAEKYLEYVDDLEMTEAQKIEFLRILWNIMSGFVELGFGVDSVMPILAQRALENGSGTVKENIPTHEFNVAADDVAEKD